ncbi:hypothetical protein IVB34_20330 [Bradyrhizobium sp. 2]|uniref:hypothetical protein n=1 Tax=Bradyrhizobium sp. 2 TaxID=190045 RepID=UPI001FF8F010|nr:hypothetical protein [Bradyrhizobium sp. 2]MCK1460651.1 hypothetical protein [Bradyrhizobium sp. 2]
MFLKMIPTGLGMSTRTTFGDQTETSHTLYFTLQLAGQDSLELETGEVFQNPRYASVRRSKQNEISAHLNVRPASDERDPLHTNKMQYHAGVKGDDYASPPFIHFDVSVPASDYSLLLSNIQGGILPSKITVGLRHNLYDKGSPLAYDFAPDGSMMIWRNAPQEDRHVGIESAEFHYRVLGADHYDEDDAAPQTAKASIDAASAAIVAKLIDLEKALAKGGGLIVTVIVIACAALYFRGH